MKKDTKKSKEKEGPDPQPVFEVILFSLSIVLLIVGVHQTMTLGFAKAYWLFMLMFTFLLLYTYLKGQRSIKAKEKAPKKKPK